MSAGCNRTLFDVGDGGSLQARQRRVLWIVLAINATMFVIEIVTSWYAGSTALLADALDFFADSATYALTLFVLAKPPRWKTVAALIKGGTMAALGLWVIFEVVRRTLDPALPDGATMGGIGALALAANLGCAALLYWHRSDDINMRSVWLCSRNDAIGNLLVIGAASGVLLSGTAWPDLAVGAVIAGLALSAAWSIIRQGLRELRAEDRGEPAATQTSSAD